MAGTVRFTGAVPSGDSKLSKGAISKTMDAVSIEIQGGRVITLMPFASINVAEGQAVSEGQALGTLAAGGDASSAGTHVHMGYKSGSTYLDPMLLFGAAAKESSEPSGRSSGSLASEPPASDIADSGSAPSSLKSSRPEGTAEQPLVSEQPAIEGAVQDALGSAFDPIETGAYDLKERDAAVASPVDALDGLTSQLRDACSEQLSSFVDALSALSKGTGIPLPVLFAVVPVLAASAVVALGAIAVRLLVPRIGSKLLRSRAAVMGVEAQEYFACH